MKIIVCGAGPVGAGIARQLVRENNSVTVVDSNPDELDVLTQNLDVSTILGVPSHPNVLEAAGALDAQMLIAVTPHDEINMVACSVASGLFNVPMKIARIQQKNYLLPEWEDLYRKDHVPIDHIISPEKEVARAIVNRLHVPGALNSLPFANHRLQVIEVRCESNCPMLGRTVEALEKYDAELPFSIIGMVRDGDVLIPYKTERLLIKDELFIAVEADDITAVMHLFGYRHKEARRILIVGGGQIGFGIAEALEAEDDDLNTKIIEMNRARAEDIAARLPKTTVIHGNSLDQDILKEANIESAEAVITVSNDDEVNILTCLLGKRAGCRTTIALINRDRSFDPLISSLGIDVVVNPHDITVSSILQHTHKGRVFTAHSVVNGQAELVEVEVMKFSALVGKPLADLEWPQGMKLGAVIRGDAILIATGKTVLQEKDHLIVMMLSSAVQAADEIFCARLDYF